VLGSGVYVSNTGNKREIPVRTELDYSGCFSAERQV
jgi:hypothetical protein